MIQEEDRALDVEAIRELMHLKVIDAGIEPEVAEMLDETLCALLGIEDPEPIIGQP